MEYRLIKNLSLIRLGLFDNVSEEFFLVNSISISGSGSNEEIIPQKCPNSPRSQLLTKKSNSTESTRLAQGTNTELFKYKTSRPVESDKPYF